MVRAKRSIAGLLVRWIVALVAASIGWGAVAAALEIAPKGFLPDQRQVHVVVTARVSPGAAVESFVLRYNGSDVTKTFLQYANVTRPDAQTIVASLDVLFPAGSHSVSAALKMAGEPAVDASTSFQVPDSDQARLRTTMLARINEMLRQYDAYAFGRVISQGDIGVFSARAQDPSFQIYIDPELVQSRGARAMYLEIWNLGLSYYRDLVLATDPELFGLGRQPDVSFHPFILWEEMVHAVSHLASVNGSPNSLPDPRGGATLESIDHFYIDWAEACVKTGLPPLKSLEELVARQGGAVPSEATIAQARGYWRFFVNNCNSSQDSRGVPDAAQRAVFKRLVGFDVDVNAVHANYLRLGWRPEYFEAATVRIVSPGVSSSVSADQVEVRATVTAAAGARIEQVGFLVNDAVVYATLAGDTFSSMLPLKLGANIIYAGVIPRAAPGTTEGPVMSTPITVTRQVPAVICPQIKNWTNTDQSLFAPLRVTRVDHSNSPGAFYFYVFANPNNRQERAITGTFFSLAASPALLRDLSFANNVGVSLVSFASGADAQEIWRRELAAWDATPPGNRPDLMRRDATTLVWGWDGIDGIKHVESLSLQRGSVIAYLTLRSTAAGEAVSQHGINGWAARAQTVQGMVDVRCGTGG